MTYSEGFVRYIVFLPVAMAANYFQLLLVVVFVIERNIICNVLISLICLVNVCRELLL